MKVIFTQEDREQEKLRKRMDRFDSVIHEYLRSNRKTIEELSDRIGCDPSSLWRYRRKVEYFQKAPFDLICTCLRLAQVSNENLRYIMDLPVNRSKFDEK